MAKNMRLIFFITVFLGILISCATKTQTIQLPDISQLPLIEVKYRWDDLEDLTTFPIRDKKNIVQLAAILDKNDRDWKRPYHPGKPFAWRILLLYEYQNEKQMIWINKSQLCHGKFSEIPRQCVRNSEKAYKIKMLIDETKPSAIN